MGGVVRGPVPGVQDRRAGGARRRQGGQRHHGRAGAAREGLSGVEQGGAPNSQPQVGTGKREFCTSLIGSNAIAISDTFCSTLLR